MQKWYSIIGRTVPTDKEEGHPNLSEGKSFVTTVTNQDISLAHAQHHAFKGDHLCHSTLHAPTRIDKCNRDPAALDAESHNSSTTTPLKSNGEYCHKE